MLPLPAVIADSPIVYTIATQADDESTVNRPGRELRILLGWKPK